MRRPEAPVPQGFVGSNPTSRTTKKTEKTFNFTPALATLNIQLILKNLREEQ